MLLKISWTRFRVHFREVGAIQCHTQKRRKEETSGQVCEQRGSWGCDKRTNEHQSSHERRSFDSHLECPSCGLGCPYNECWSGTQMLHQRQHVGTKRRVCIRRPIGTRFALPAYIDRHDTVSRSNEPRREIPIFGAEVTPGGHTENQRTLALVIKSNRSISELQVVRLHWYFFLRLSTEDGVICLD